MKSELVVGGAQALPFGPRPFCPLSARPGSDVARHNNDHRQDRPAIHDEKSP